MPSTTARLSDPPNRLPRLGNLNKRMTSSNKPSTAPPNRVPGQKLKIKDQSLSINLDHEDDNSTTVAYDNTVQDSTGITNSHSHSHNDSVDRCDNSVSVQQQSHSDESQSIDVQTTLAQASGSLEYAMNVLNLDSDDIKDDDKKVQQPLVNPYYELVKVTDWVGGNNKFLTRDFSFGKNLTRGLNLVPTVANLESVNTEANHDQNPIAEDSSTQSKQVASGVSGPVRSASAQPFTRVLQLKKIPQLNFRINQQNPATTSTVLPGKTQQQQSPTSESETGEDKASFFRVGRTISKQTYDTINHDLEVPPNTTNSRFLSLNRPGSQSERVRSRDINQQNSNTINSTVTSNTLNNFKMSRIKSSSIEPTIARQAGQKFLAIGSKNLSLFQKSTNAMVERSNIRMRSVSAATPSNTINTNGNTFNGTQTGPGTEFIQKTSQQHLLQVPNLQLQGQSNVPSVTQNTPIGTPVDQQLQGQESVQGHDQEGPQKHVGVPFLDVFGQPLRNMVNNSTLTQQQNVTQQQQQSPGPDNVESIIGSTVKPVFNKTTSYKLMKKLKSVNCLLGGSNLGTPASNSVTNIKTAASTTNSSSTSAAAVPRTVIQTTKRIFQIPQQKIQNLKNLINLQNVSVVNSGTIQAGPTAAATANISTATLASALNKSPVSISTNYGPNASGFFGPGGPNQSGSFNTNNSVSYSSTTTAATQTSANNDNVRSIPLSSIPVTHIHTEKSSGATGHQCHSQSLTSNSCPVLNINNSILTSTGGIMNLNTPRLITNNILNTPRLLNLPGAIVNNNCQTQNHNLNFTPRFTGSSNHNVTPMSFRSNGTVGTSSYMNNINNITPRFTPRFQQSTNLTNQMSLFTNRNPNAVVHATDRDNNNSVTVDGPTSVVQQYPEGSVVEQFPQQNTTSNEIKLQDQIGQQQQLQTQLISQSQSSEISSNQQQNHCQVHDPNDQVVSNQNKFPHPRLLSGPQNINSSGVSPAHRLSSILEVVNEAQQSINQNIATTTSANAPIQIAAPALIRSSPIDAISSAGSAAGLCNSLGPSPPMVPRLSGSEENSSLSESQQNQNLQTRPGPPERRPVKPTQNLKVQKLSQDNLKVYTQIQGHSVKLQESEVPEVVSPSNTIELHPTMSFNQNFRGNTNFQNLNSNLNSKSNNEDINITDESNADADQIQNQHDKIPEPSGDSDENQNLEYISPQLLIQDVNNEIQNDVDIVQQQPEPQSPDASFLDVDPQDAVSRTSHISNDSINQDLNNCVTNCSNTRSSPLDNHDHDHNDDEDNIENGVTNTVSSAIKQPKSSPEQYRRETAQRRSRLDNLNQAIVSLNNSDSRAILEQVLRKDSPSTLIDQNVAAAVEANNTVINHVNLNNDINMKSEPQSCQSEFRQCLSDHGDNNDFNNQAPITNTGADKNADDTVSKDSKNLNLNNDISPSKLKFEDPEPSTTTVQNQTETSEPLTKNQRKRRNQRQRAKGKGKGSKGASKGKSQ